MNKNVKIGLWVGGIALASYLLYRFTKKSGTTKSAPVTTEESSNIGGGRGGMGGGMRGGMMGGGVPMGMRHGGGVRPPMRRGGRGFRGYGYPYPVFVGGYYWNGLYWVGEDGLCYQKNALGQYILVNCANTDF